ncbi:ComEC/Rec2 family competence protein [Fibrobacter succinogenes]|uniref:ComEC/Rec2 family competence protein n=1 Tax=Fibrobacter succinogenes TaxID=833 RepID=UPI0025FB62F7|nr:MBL fold metallo-hydrolase [Fibrobacter succinogenes]
MNRWIYMWVLLCAILWSALLCVFGGALLSGCSYDSGWGAEPEPLRVTFLDVGQGLAVLLEHDGHFALYDTGPDSAGLVDTLAGRGVKALDWVLVSHFHRDHGGGFMEMGAAIESGRLKVGRLLVGLDTAVGFVSDSVFKVARRYKIPVDTLERGDTVYFAEGLRLECLWPVSYGRFGENRASVVLMGSMVGPQAGRESAILLTGDLDTVGENRLMELSRDLSADLLQVGHHGSAGSSGLQFLAQVAPKYAAIGVGKNNRYGHPKDEVVNKLYIVTGDSSAVYRTDLHGSFSFEMWPGVGLVVP